MPKYDFINPYVFVPLGEGCVRKPEEQWSEGKRYSGYFTCELTTKTPLFIPNTSSDRAFPNFTKDEESGRETFRSEDFFSYTALNAGDHSQRFYEPVIPGSSLKGMIRHYFETIHDTCLSRFEEERHFYQSLDFNGAKNHHPAILERSENGNWRLFEAITVNLNDRGQAEGERVTSFGQKDLNSLRKNDISEEFDTVYFHKTGDMHSKRSEKGFVKAKPEKILVANANELAERYKTYAMDGIDLHRNENDKRELFQGYLQSLESRGRVLCYYEKINGEYYLRPAQIGREQLLNTAGNLVGNYGPCAKEDTEGLCLSCHVFGMISDEQSLRSKVRVTDAHWAKESDADPATVYESIRFMPILGEPKPSSTEFYFEKPEGVDLLKRFTVDYYIENNGKESHAPRILGRKFYWHHPVKSLAKDAEKNPNLMGAVRPLKSNVRFRFKVYFDDLNGEEIKALGKAIYLGDGYHQKLGRGKPYGYGSVDIGLDSCVVKNLEEGTLEQVRPFWNDLSLGLKGYEEIFRFKALEKEYDRVRYPEVNGDTFKWFQKNRKGKIEHFLKDPLVETGYFSEGKLKFFKIRDGKPSFGFVYGEGGKEEFYFSEEDVHDLNRLLILVLQKQMPTLRFHKVMEDGEPKAKDIRIIE